MQLQRRWAIEVGEDADDEQQFIDRAATWARTHRSTHLPHIAIDSEGALVGMAWLALTPRVASRGSLNRWSGDLQSCYVLLELRGLGIGGALVQSVLADAKARGVEHVTVHASPESVRMYTRHGFGSSAQLWWADVSANER